MKTNLQPIETEEDDPTTFFAEMAGVLPQAVECGPAERRPVRDAIGDRPEAHRLRLVKGQDSSKTRSRQKK